MAAVTPAKSVLHSSKPNPHPSRFSTSPSNLINARTTQLGFRHRLVHQAKPTKLVEGFGGLNRGSRTERLQRKPWAVTCTAEGIERGMLIGRRERGGGGEAKQLVRVPERFKVVALLACVMCLCNADRVVMSVAVVPLAAQKGWTSSFLGVVQVLL